MVISLRSLGTLAASCLFLHFSDALDFAGYSGLLLRARHRRVMKLRLNRSPFDLPQTKLSANLDRNERRSESYAGALGIFDE